MKFTQLLQGGSIQSLGKSAALLEIITDQKSFDELFRELDQPDRIIVMRAADVVEKVTIQKPEFLQKHKEKILELCRTATPIGLKWHLALLLPRLSLTADETGMAWNILMSWACDKKESRILRTHSVQSLYQILQRIPELKRDFELAVHEIYRENIPSVNARMRLLRIVDRH